MARARTAGKSFLSDPLKMGPPIGAAMAFLGLGGAVPLLLGARGCASVGLSILIRHFQQPLAVETLDLDEAAIALGGSAELARALAAIQERHAPALVGLISSGLGETRGDDVEGSLRLLRRQWAESQPARPALETVFVSCPDFKGGYQDGWGAAVRALVDKLAGPAGPRRPGQVNLLMGHHLTPGEVEEIKDILEAFGLDALVLPDISGARGGLAPGPGGLERLRQMGCSEFTIALGEHLRPAAQLLEARAGVPYQVFARLSGLGPCDEFMALLARLSGREPPGLFQRQRARLLEAMLAAYPFFTGRQVAVASDPDHLFGFCAWLVEMGAQVRLAVASTESPMLRRIPAAQVLVGDLQDLEQGARGADLLIGPSSLGPVAGRLGIPLLRAGMPVTDRLDAPRKVCVGYRGTCALIYEAANLLRQDAGRAPG